MVINTKESLAAHTAPMRTQEMQRSANSAWQGSPMQVDVVLNAPLGSVAEQAARLYAAGAAGGFTQEASRDAFFPLAEAADSGLFIYPNVAIAFPRSPMHLAYQAWDLQRLSQGNFALGLGSQIKPHIEKRFSARWDKPVRQMRDYVLALKAIFDTFQTGAPLNFRSDYHTFTLMTPNFSPGALECGVPPIWVGALGPLMTKAAAEVADGVLIHPFNSERFLRETTMPIIDTGLDRRGLGRDQFTIGVDVITGIHRTDAERAAADAGCRINVAFYASTPSYRVTLDAHGWGDLQPQLNALSKQGRWADMPGLITDEMLDAFCVRGTPEQARAELERRFDGIADRVALSLPYGVAPGLLEDLLR
jgi:probable F420-dependent oxidoreductase